jgi:hypothetical protein
MLTGLLLGLLAAGLVAWVRRRPRGAARPALADQELPTLERGLCDLRPGDVVQYGGQDHLVLGTLHYDEDGHTWSLGRLFDGARECWLVIGWEEKGPFRLLWPADEVDLGDAPPEIVSYDRVAYRLSRRGTAQARLAGDLGPLGEALPRDQPLCCRYWRYQASRDHCLLVEEWGKTLRILAGRAVSEDELCLLVGS